MKHRAARGFTRLVWPAALVGCGLADSGQTPATGEGAPDESPGERPAAHPIDGDTRITLERTQCYGACPVYSLSITGDGIVSYVGELYVNVKGAASKQVPLGDVQALVDQMVQADYFALSMPEDCPEGVYSDHPSVRTSLALGERRHAIDRYGGNLCAPDVLSPLEDTIDTVAGSAAWIECGTPGDACCGPIPRSFNCR